MNSSSPILPPAAILSPQVVGLGIFLLALGLTAWIVRIIRRRARREGAARGEATSSASRIVRWPVLLGLATALSALGLLGFWGDGLLLERARSELGRELTTILGTTTRAVERWFEEREAEVAAWAMDPTTVSLAAELTRLDRTNESLSESLVQQELGARLAPILEGANYRGFAILAADGMTLASSRLADVGTAIRGDRALDLIDRVSAPATPAVVTLPERGTGTNFAIMLAGAAIRDAAGDLQGVLVLQIDPEKGFTEILHRGRMGSSGESYAFDRNASLISESRFDGDLRRIGLVPDSGRSILTIEIRDPGGNMIEGHRPELLRENQPLTLMAQSALDGRSDTNLIGYNDYRGVPVIGSWTWDERRGLGVATEIDVAEAFKSIGTTRRLFFLVSGITAVLLVLLTALFLRSQYRQASANEERAAAVMSSMRALERANEELEGASCVILRWEPDGTVLYLNKFGQELFGFSESEIIGKSLLETIVPLDQRREEEIQEWIDNLEAKPEHERESSEHENRRKDGGSVWMAWRHQLIRNPDRSLREILAVGIDITERKRAEQKLEAVSESAADAIVLGDTSDTVIGWNGAAETILGWSRDEMLGRSLQTLIPERYRAAHRAGIDRINQTGEGRVLGKTMELTALHREGHEVEIELSLSTWMVASERFYTGIIRDITERKKMEAALQKSYDTVAAAHARMEKDLEAAARVQQSLLPASLPGSDRVRIAWQYHPCDELAGDSLNVHSLGPRHVAFYIVDVSGHGVPAALLSVSVARSLEPSEDPSCLVTDPSGAVTNPAEVAQRLNTLYPKENYGDHYFTMVYGVLNLETGNFRFITAGHSGPILVRPGEPPKQVVAPSLMIGALPGVTFSDSEVRLAGGDRLYLFSDGLYEEVNDADEQFEIPRLMEALASRIDEPLDASLESVRQDLVAWHGSDSFTDDFSVLAVEMLGT